MLGYKSRTPATSKVKTKESPTKAMTNDQKIRYLRLNQVFNKALTQSISKLESWEKVSSCFPDYADTREGASNLINCQRQVIEFWTELCKREFEEILVERDVKEKLDQLDELISEAKRRLRDSASDGPKERDGTPIDELSSEELVKCNLYEERIRANNQLDQRIATMKKLNDGLEQELNELETSLSKEQLELTKLYEKWVGSAIEQPLDETLAQGLDDMLLELRDI